MKKILTALAAIAVAFSLMGCVVDDQGVNWNTYTKDKQNKIAYYAQIAPSTTLKGTWFVPDTVFFEADDTQGAIKGSNDNYTVEYTNSSTSDAYRAYKETTLNHAGALIKVTFNSANVSTSKMGVIFDLKDDDENEGAKEFYIIGLNPKTTEKNFYVSKFTNVTDIQAYNFGTKAKTNPAKEVEIVALDKANNIPVPEADADGNISFYVYYKLMADGTFNYAVLDMTDEDMANFKGSTKFNKAKIDDYTVLAKGNTKAAGTEYAAYEAKK
jgi:uncharacterized lipoprotein NlpE involved in copper resistance